MGTMSRGKGNTHARVAKFAKKNKKPKTTESNRNHRFETFSERIAKLKIDPVRHGDQAHFHGDQEKETSYLRSSFDAWKELNMSENFVSFADQMNPLCQSLPQIIYHQNEIVDLLVKYLERDDALCLEPLLSMTAQLAHDIGAKFEKHFGRIVAIVCHIAAKHSDVEVIEWSFNCLAWLFRHLSRLLVSDLRPLYDLMAPLLGKDRQKHFVTRFAAEAFTFLIRKAAASYEKKKAPLDLIVKHAFQDLARSAETAPQIQQNQYEDGLANVFADSIKGVQRGVHLTGSAVFQALLSYTMHEDRSLKHVLCKILTNVLHHCDSTGFTPLFQLLHEQTSNESTKMDASKSDIAYELQFVMIGVRKGSRISDWSLVLGRIAGNVDQISKGKKQPSDELLGQIVRNLGIAFQYAPLEDVVQYNPQIMSKITRAPWKLHFLPFCIFFADLEFDRFNRLILNHLKRFIVNHWEEHEEQFSNMISKFCEKHIYIEAPSGLSEKLLISFRDLNQHLKLRDHEKCRQASRLCDQYINVLRCHTENEPLSHDLTAEMLESIKSTASQELASHSEPYANFIMGPCFLLLAQRWTIGDVQPELWVQLCQASYFFACLPTYLEAMCLIVKLAPDVVKDNNSYTDFLIANLEANLAAPSSSLRSKSLEMLKAIFDTQHTSAPTLFDIALSIESIPPAAENTRSASAIVRRLASSFDNLVDLRVKKCIVAFCFGLLHHRLATISIDACTALQSMSQVKGVDDMIMERATAWLNINSNTGTCSDPSLHAEILPSMTSPAFECSNLLMLEKLATTQLDVSVSADKQLQERFENDIRQERLHSASSRAKALQVLTYIPQIAEKRSRTIVPLFLNLRHSTEQEEPKEIELSSEDDTLPGQDFVQSVSPGDWSRKDEKSLVDLFGKFSNPSVLYKSNDVLSLLLDLLSNGDAGFQKSALKAISAWKFPYIKPYEEHMFNLLDDARLREEITVFLAFDSSDGVIREEHRQGLIPILFRLLYGRMVARGGAAGRNNFDSKRKAIHASLARFSQAELAEFITIALGSLDNLSLTRNNEVDEDIASKEIISVRKQLGILKSLDGFIESLSNLLEPFVYRLSNAILYCLLWTSRKMKASADDLTGKTEVSHLSLLKSTYQTGLSCLITLFSKFPEFDWQFCSCIVFAEIVNPKLQRMPIETAQGISAKLKLFSTWSSNPKLVDWLVLPNKALLSTLANCLSELSVEDSNLKIKDEVKLYVTEKILNNVLLQAGVKDTPESARLRGHLQGGPAFHILTRLSQALDATNNKDLLEACVKATINLSPFLDGAVETDSLIRTLLGLLRQPSKNVSPRLKSQVLSLLGELMELEKFQAGDDCFEDLVQTLSLQFSYFLDATNRQKLVALYSRLAQIDKDLDTTAEICASLNSYASGRLSEPDYERRLDAFRQVNEGHFAPSSTKQWLAIIHNMLFLVRDNEEFSIRTSASLGLRRFIQMVGLAATQSTDDDNHAVKKKELIDLLHSTILPAIQKGMKEPSELVRAEYITILAEIVNTESLGMSDMKILAEGEPDSSFFVNILHIQQNRRSRALRLLASKSERISSANIWGFCIPLIQNFITDADEGTHNLAAEAISTLDVITESLDWQRYKTLLHRTVGEISKLDSKIRIRTLGAVVNGLYRSCRSKTKELDNGNLENRTSNPDANYTQLSKTLPLNEVMNESLSKPLARLMEHIHFKDESTVDLRVMLSLITVKLIMSLPQERIGGHLTALLMDLTNVLRSKAQEARDSARKTLADIAAVIGPAYFLFMVKQLRSTLQRGSHLHVLSYTIHSLLVAVVPQYAVGDLDDCIADLMAVVDDDIFGATGQEKESKDYTSKMTEVKKKNLSFDSLELIATRVSLSTVSRILRPIRVQLDKSRPKIEKCDELLRRFREGLRRNANANDQQLLVLCYEVINESFEKAEKTKRLTTLSAFKMVTFGLELLRRVLDKHESLKTATNLSGFMPLISRSIEQADEDVQASALRCLTSIVKVPLPILDESAGEYIRMAKRIIEAAPSTNTPLAQSALRLSSAVLRERPNAIIKQSFFEHHIAYMLHRIKPDLQEPSQQGERDRQVAAFNFLRAILSRGVLIKEVYEIMDVVREVMIISGEHPIPDLARSIYSRFILDYFPDEGKGLAKQLDFVVSNLKYPSARGRLSSMEVLLFILTKKNEASVQALLVEVFLPLVVVVIADESEDCRGSARILLSKVFERADNQHLNIFKSQLRNWLAPDTDILWRQASLNCWKIYFEIHNTARKDAATVYELAAPIVISSSGSSTQHTNELLRDVFELFGVLCESFPDLLFDAGKAKMWNAVPTILTNAIPSTRLSGVKFLGMYLTHFKKSCTETGKNISLPLIGLHGLTLTGSNALSLAKAHMRLLQEEPSDVLAEYITQNVAFLALASAAGDAQDIVDQLLIQVSSAIRSDESGRSPKTKLHAMKILAALCRIVPANSIQPSLREILLPLQNLTDTAIPTMFSNDPEQIANQEQLVNLAHELLAALQKKLGTTSFVEQMQQVQQEVRERREERRAKRRIEVVAAPEKAGREKQRKNMVKKEKRREKNSLAAGRRRGY